MASKTTKSDQYVPVVKKSKESSALFNLNAATNINSINAGTTTVAKATATASTNASAFIPPPPQPTTTPVYVDPSSYQLVGNVDNIDERDRHDPLSVPEYAQEMYLHFKEQERTTSVRPHYLSMQPQINETMRAILVDWMINVQVQFRLVPDTLYLAVNLLDRYLEKVEVPRTKLQLAGITALFIAAKYEEVWAPRIYDFVSVCDNLYSRQEIVQMEKHMLNALKYKISMPTAYTFLVRYLKAAHADVTIAQISCYILEVTLLSYPLLRYLPSQLAAAAILVARNSTGRNPWSPTLLRYAQYYEEDIMPIARDILDKKSRIDSNLTAVNKKYGAKRFGRVAAHGAFLSCE